MGNTPINPVDHPMALVLFVVIMLIILGTGKYE